MRLRRTGRFGVRRYHADPIGGKGGTRTLDPGIMRVPESASTCRRDSRKSPARENVLWRANQQSLRALASAAGALVQRSFSNNTPAGPAAWSTVDHAHTFFVATLAAGRREIVQPSDLFV